MKIPEEGYLLRVFVGESDKWHGRPLYEAIVLKARELHLAGATVLRGPMGYGAQSRLHTTKILQLSEDLPMIIEIIDAKEKIDELLPHIDEMVQEGLVTLEPVQVIEISRLRQTRPDDRLPLTIHHARRSDLYLRRLRRGDRHPARPLSGREPALRRGLPGLLPPEPDSRRVRRRGRRPRVGRG